MVSDGALAHGRRSSTLTLRVTLEVVSDAEAAVDVGVGAGDQLQTRHDLEKEFERCFAHSLVFVSHARQTLT